MKNAIVFTAGGRRFAVELRWVRDVIALGSLTPVPRGPRAIVGVVNVRGAITPVLDLVALLDPDSGAPARAGHAGDGAVMLEVEGARAAIAVDAVQSVMSLAEPPSGEPYVDHRGHPLELLDPPALMRATAAAAQAAAGRIVAELGERRR